MKPCLPPLATTPQPSWRAPALSCDCHFHIFGPYDRFPLDAGRHYDPQAATIADYQRMADALGIERMVIVQPSVYGTQNEVSLDAAEQFGLDRARVVVVIDDSFDEAALKKLHARGTMRSAVMVRRWISWKRWRGASRPSAGICSYTRKGISFPNSRRVWRHCRCL